MGHYHTKTENPHFRPPHPDENSDENYQIHFRIVKPLADILNIIFHEEPSKRAACFAAGELFGVSYRTVDQWFLRAAYRTPTSMALVRIYDILKKKGVHSGTHKRGLNYVEIFDQTTRTEEEMELQSLRDGFVVE